MARKPDPKSKAGFVRSLPTSMSAADAVAKAKREGIKLDESYVYSVRTAMNRKRKKAKAPPAIQFARVVVTGAPRASNGGVGNGLVGEIERIVEAKVNAMLKEKLGALFGG